MIGAVSVSPAAQRLGLYFATAPGRVLHGRPGGRVPPGPAPAPAGEGGRGVGPGRQPQGAGGPEVPDRRTQAADAGAAAGVRPGPEPGRGRVVVAEVRASWPTSSPTGSTHWTTRSCDRLIELKFDPDLLRSLWERSDLPFPTRASLNWQLHSGHPDVRLLLQPARLCGVDPPLARRQRRPRTGDLASQPLTFVGWVESSRPTMARRRWASKTRPT